MFAQQNFKKFFLFAVILVLGIVSLTGIASADLTKQDIEEIRMIIKDEIQHVHDRIDNLDKRIDGLDKRMDGLQNMMLCVLAGIFSLIGFVLWDRRSALAPAIRKQEALEKKGDAIERALREFAMKEPRFAEALKFAGLL